MLFVLAEKLQKNRSKSHSSSAPVLVAMSLKPKCEWTCSAAYQVTQEYTPSTQILPTELTTHWWYTSCSLCVSVSVAWLAFTICMSAGVSTLNNYTKKVLMVGPRRTSGLNACSFNFVGLLPPYYNPATPLACPPSPPRISHLSPYYEPPSAALPASTPRLTHSNSLPPSLSHSDSFPPPPPHAAPASPFHRLSLPSPIPSPIHMTLPGHRENHYDPEEDYSPLWTAIHI